MEDINRQVKSVSARQREGVAVVLVDLIRAS